MNAGVATLSAMALAIAAWMWWHHQALKTTTLLALLGGIGFGGALGLLFAQAITWLVGLFGSTTAAWIGVSTSAVVTAIALIATLEVILKGIWPRTADPRRWHPLLAVALPTIIIAAGVPVLAAAMGGISSGMAEVTTWFSTGSPTATAAAAGAVACAPVAGLSAAQMANAAAIVRAGQDLDVPERAQVIAVATAMQEANLKNYANETVPASLALPHEAVGSDHDSVGLFQQRAVGWGSLTTRMDPHGSATTFYRRLTEVPGWEAMPLTQAAQTVQRSAFPAAYAKWEDDATTVVASLQPGCGPSRQV